MSEGRHLRSHPLIRRGINGGSAAPLKRITMAAGSGQMGRFRGRASRKGPDRGRISTPKTPNRGPRPPEKPDRGRISTAKTPNRGARPRKRRTGDVFRSKSGAPPPLCAHKRPGNAYLATWGSDRSVCCVIRIGRSRPWPDRASPRAAAVGSVAARRSRVLSVAHADGRTGPGQRLIAGSRATYRAAARCGKCAAAAWMTAAWELVAAASSNRTPSSTAHIAIRSGFERERS